MNFKVPAALLLASTMLVGCDAELELGDPEASPASGKADKGDSSEPEAPSFWYFDGDRPFSDDDAERVWAALDLLVEAGATHEGERGALARETLARIDRGDVLMGAILDASGIDLWHMCKDLEHKSCKGVARSDDFVGNDALRKALAVDLDGYMWGQRLYFSFNGDRDDELLASTLVHEVNHVLNVSHCSYYADLDTHAVDQTLAYIEEFRAFFAECFFVAAAEDLEGCATWADKELVDRGYDLTPDLSTVLPKGQDNPVGLATVIVQPQADLEFGALIPTAEAWPEDFSPCEPS